MGQAGAEQFDVVVIGGGPGGSSLAAFVAMRGHRVLVLEKERFPRYQIGESLLPATVRGTCRLLGVGDDLREAGFTVKRGGYFKWGSSPEPWILDFTAIPGLEEGDPAYQVDRMTFDHILLKNARRTGADVREECTVTEVIEGAERVEGVRYRDAGGHEHVATGRIVVDASGNTGRFFQTVSGNRVYSDFFRNIALFGYFAGGRRLPEPFRGNIMTVAFEHGWFWYIPLRPELTSVGAVVARERADLVRGDRAEALLSLIDQCPMVREFLSGVERVTSGTYGEVRTRRDYSYSADRYWRPGMVLIGDAACFVDPVLSSGVHLATYSALLAARSINSTLRGDLTEEVAFDEFESRYRREYAHFYEFLVSFYDRHLDEESYFWKAKKLINHPAGELAAFTSLVSGMSSEDRGLTGTDEPIWLPPQTDAFTPAGRFPDWDTDQHIRFDAHHPLFETQPWVPGLPNQGPRPGGLIPSEDGLHWAVPQTAPVAT